MKNRKLYYLLPGILLTGVGISLGQPAQPHSCVSVAVPPDAPATVTLAGKAPTTFSHYSFSDAGWFYPVTQPWSPYTPGTSAAVDASLVSFFNKNLKAEDDHFLDQPPPQYPAVFNFKKK